MTLGKKQELFARMLPLLFSYAHFLGYQIRPKYLLRCQDCKVGHPNSTHKSGLAIDIVLSVDGEIIWGDEPYAQLHSLWDLLGGAERIKGDLGHFSISHNGVR